jgi:tetratricopeptide (TPR) repeat protein
MSDVMLNERAETLRLEALAKVRANELEAALEIFDEAIDLADDNELRELLMINKAGVLIQMRREGPEVQALPQIVLRRPNVRHTFLAAYNLQNRYTLSQEYRKAYNYVRIALEMAEEAGDHAWTIGALNATGNICVYESRNAEAIEHYRNVLDRTGTADEHIFSRAFARQNLGYCLLIEGQPAEGIEEIHRAIGEMVDAGAEGYAAESYIDLCYGYLELGMLDDAKHYGELGLEKATEDRQVRNAHYLLGEVAYKQGDRDAAEAHFERLGSWYPDFPNLKNILMALDLRKVVNFKL